MGDNGDLKEKQQPEQQKEPQTIEMRIIVEKGNPMVVHYPFLNDKIATYGFLKMAEKVLDAHYAQIAEKIIQPVHKHGIIDFIRGKR